MTHAEARTGAGVPAFLCVGLKATGLRDAQSADHVRLGYKRSNWVVDKLVFIYVR